MREENASPDKFEDIKEVTEQIYTLVWEYDFTLQDQIETMFSVLERKIQAEIAWGNDGINMCNMVMNAYLDLTENMMDFEVSLHD